MINKDSIFYKYKTPVKNKAYTLVHFYNPLCKPFFYTLAIQQPALVTTTSLQVE